MSSNPPAKRRAHFSCETGCDGLSALGLAVSLCPLLQGFARRDSQNDREVSFTAFANFCQVKG
jgi:hypothetical protein